MSRRNKNKKYDEERLTELDELIAKQKEDFIDQLKHSTDNKSKYKLRKGRRGVN